MAFTIRHAFPSEIPAIVDIDIAANKETSALISMNWLAPSDLHALFIQRYTHSITHPNQCQVLVAIAPPLQTTSAAGSPEEEIAGFIVGTRPKKDGDESWKPTFPEGGNVEVFGYYLGLLAEDKKKYFTDDFWELESLSISPSYQRRGIGSLLIQKWLEQIDPSGGSIYVRATKVGRSLYEKFGWVQEGEWSIDLTKYGRKEPVTNYNMKRAGTAK